jgi:hypothetical protein
MRALATAIVPLGMFGLSTEIRTEQSGSCVQCRQQQQACMKNYSAKVCKNEYDICMKGYQKK